MTRFPRLAATLSGLVAATSFAASTGVHVTYHWHLHQPIYWPETAPGLNRMQYGWDSVNLKNTNQGNYYPGSSFEHPRNQLVNGDGGEYEVVFDKDDRKAAYQAGGKDSIATMLHLPDAGASVSYSGSLMENMWSFGSRNSYGYGPGWNNGYTTARNWTTSAGKPRADMVGITFHHAFSPLLPRSVLRKEVQIFKERWWKSWGGNPDKSDHSRGFWPVECAFSRHMIPVLAAEGYQWTFVANSHLARTCANYTNVAARGTSGWNIDPPNRADQLGPTVPANQWWSGQQDGRGGAFPAPFAYTPAKVKHVDPETGLETKMTAVPMCDLLSYQNGYGTMGTGDIDAHIAPFNNPAQPSLVVLAHDGDNAWGGGSSYYFESVPGLANAATGRGYRMSTVQQYLADHPVPDSSVVHVEDGAWFNAANDWGHPQFINWLWPPTRRPSDPAYNANDPRTWYDFETPGLPEDFRNWAVLMAGANYCETAEQISGDRGQPVQAWRIEEPTQHNGTNNNPLPAEQAWHYFLGGLDSGFMYYGTSLDDEVKQTLACNRAIPFAQAVIGDAGEDRTPPTVFKPQRFPWNPGGAGWGPLTGYRPVGLGGAPPYSSDFHVWTHAFDVSGVASVTLRVRVDADGVNPLASNQNETFAGGAEVGAWVSLPMTKRVLPRTNVDGNSQIDYFLQPVAMADYYFAKVTGYRNRLLDYYIEAVDTKGHVHKSDIQHVWVADDGSSPNPPPAPAGLVAAASGTDRIVLGWNAAAGAASYQVWRDGGLLTTTTATSHNDTGLAPSSTHCYTVRAVNGAGASADSAAACATTGAPPPVPAAPSGLAAAAVAHHQVNLTWTAAPHATSYRVLRGATPVGTPTSPSFSDTGLSAQTTYCYTVVAINASGESAASAPACATTPALPPTPPFTLDGAADQPGWLVRNPGMTIYAAVFGNHLYLATWSPGSAGGPNDHFLFVTDTLLPAATAAAPWAKAGFTAVPAGKPYLGAEGANSHIGWVNAPAGSPRAKAATSAGQMEGQLDLVAAFGAVPEWVHVASAAYQTADGGVLAAQAPAPVAPANGNLDPSEFITLHVPSLRDHNNNGVYDVLDPAASFRVLTGANLLWSPAFPGATYRWESTEALGSPWTGAGDTVAGPAQTTLQLPLPVTGETRRYYRLVLVSDGLP